MGMNFKSGLRLLTALAVLAGVPGPVAWSQVAEIRLAVPASSGAGAAAAVPSAASLSASPLASVAGWSAPAASNLAAAPAPAPALAVAAAASAQAAGLPAEAAGRASAPAAPLAAPASAAAASSPETAAADALAIELIPAAAAAPNRADAAAPAAKPRFSFLGLAALFSGRKADAAFDGRAAKGEFDPSTLQVHLTGPGRRPVSLPLSELGAALAADPAYREALARSGRVRWVVRQGATDASGRGLAAELTGFLKGAGVKRALEIESIAAPRAAAAAPTVDASAPAAAAPSPSGTGVRGALAAVFSPARELAFLAAQFKTSITRPSRDEVVGGLLSRAPFIAINVLAFAPLYLPHHPVAFALLAGLTLGLKTFHSFWVDGWAAFQNRLARLRGIPYLTGFNLVYGQIVAAIYRTISWSALPGVVPPWRLSYWRDMGVVTLLGTFIGTLASQGINSLYEKGVLSRKGRSFFIQARALTMDGSGYFFKTGLMGSFWIIFGVQQALDFSFYLVSALMKPRAVLYIAAEGVSASPEFKSLYPAAGGAVAEPSLKRALKALGDGALVGPFLRLFRRSNGKADHAKDLARAYERALADPSLEDAAVLARFERVTPRLGPEGWALPATSEGGISVPVLVDDAQGRPGVFKPIRMEASNPLYPYERMKLLREIAGSAVMRRLGVPTVEYRLARASLDGREVLGVVSPFMTIRHPVAGSAEERRLIASETFARGAVADAWLGNTDRIVNRGNLWIEGEGEGSGMVFGDFDQAFRDGVSVLGVPKVPLAFHDGSVSAPAAARALEDVRRLDDASIRGLVDAAIASVGGYGAASREYLSSVLIANRDALRSADALRAGAGGPRVRLSPEAADALADAVLRGAPDDADRAIDESLRDVVLLWTHPELAAPTKELLKRIVADRRAGRRAAVELGPDRLDLLPVLINFVYAKVTPSAAIAGGIGYYP
jgi:hypothetical protein